MTIAKKLVLPGLPANTEVKKAREALDAATLNNIAAIAGAASAYLATMTRTGKTLKTSVLEATLRVIGKEPLHDVVPALRAVILSSAGHVPNLSTLRTAAIKMIVAYGMGHALPVWLTVADAKAGGDAAFTASVGACFNDVDGVPSLQESSRDALLVSIDAACSEFGVSDDSKGRIVTAYHAAFVAYGAPAEAEPLTDDEKAVEEQKAQAATELQVLRDIAAACRAAFGKPELSDVQLLAEIESTDFTS